MAVQPPEINLVLLLPEVVLALLAMALLLLSAWMEKGERPFICSLAVAGVALTGIIVLSSSSEPATTFGGLFITDSLSRYMKLLLLIATGFSLLMSREYIISQKMESGEYFVLTLFALLGGMTMASAGDFIILYLGLELMSLSIYVLAAFKRDNIRSSEAGLKYFILGSMASGLLLYGISLIYGITGSTQFQTVGAFLLAHADHVNPVTLLGAIFILSGLSFKIAAAPFHMWAPDVYEGAPTSVTAFMAVMPKIAAFVVLFRVLLVAFAPLQPNWGPILQFMAVASLAVGSLAAIAQTNIKRMLAYSSVGHVGFLLLGFVAGNMEGYQSVLVYLSIYIFMNLGAFCLVLLLNKGGLGEEINDFKGLAHKRPLLGFLMALFMFSMAGIPPLAGFIGKLYVFMAVVKAGMVGLAIVGVLFSAIGAFYYLRVVKVIYFDQPDNEFTMTLNLPSQVVLTVSTAVVLVFGLFPGQLLAWTQATIRSFM